MEPTNHIVKPVPILSNTIGPSIQQPPKPTRNKKKHLVEVLHLEDGTSYYGTRITYRWSYQFSLCYENVDIFKSEEYSFLINSYQKRLTVVKGAHISYVQKDAINEKMLANRRKRVAAASDTINIADEISLNLDEPHYVDDPDDVEYFRGRNCRFVIDLFPNGYVRFIQEQHRPARYINSVDNTQRFDCNSLLVYIDTNRMAARLKEHVHHIISGYGDSKQRYVRRFVRDLAWYTTLLYYINWSRGWEFKEIDYSKLWNLAMYIIYIFKVFDGKADWFPGIKEAYVKYLFEQWFYNAFSGGVKHFFAKASTHLRKETRYAFPESYTKVQREMFKLMVKTPSKEDLSNRNKEIRDLYSRGKSVVWLANTFKLSTRQIYNIIP